MTCGWTRRLPLPLLLLWPALQPLPATAAPPVTVELTLDPATALVNAPVVVEVIVNQAQAVAELTVLPPAPRLADVVTAGDAVVDDAIVAGQRVRRTRQTFLLFPFASGPLELTAGARVRRPGEARAETVTAGRVLPVRPAPAGAATWRPATALTLAETWTVPTPLRVGDVVTRIVDVRAEGLRAAALTAPDAEPPPGPTDGAGAGNRGAPINGQVVELARDEAVAARRLHSHLRLRYTYVAPAPGTATLPALTLTWWPTAQDEPATARLPARPLLVTPAAPAPAPERPGTTGEATTAAGRTEGAGAADGTGRSDLLGLAGLMALAVLAALLTRVVALRRRRWAPLPRRVASARAAYGAVDRWWRASRPAGARGGSEGTEAVGVAGEMARRPDGELAAALWPLDRAAFGPGAARSALAQEPVFDWPRLRRLLMRARRSRRPGRPGC